MSLRQEWCGECVKRMIGIHLTEVNENRDYSLHFAAQLVKTASSDLKYRNNNTSIDSRDYAAD